MYNYGVNDTVLELDELDFSAPFVFYAHGWESSAQNSDMLKIAEAYLNKSEYNVIAVDWAPEADGGYILAVEYVESVGECVDFMTNLSV